MHLSSFKDSDKRKLEEGQAAMAAEVVPSDMGDAGRVGLSCFPHRLWSSYLRFLKMKKISLGNRDPGVPSDMGDAGRVGLSCFPPLIIVFRSNSLRLGQINLVWLLHVHAPAKRKETSRELNARA